MGTRQTTTLKLVDKESVTEKLNKLEETCDNLSFVYDDITTINSHELIPEDFYVGFEEINIGEFENMKESFITLLSDLKSYLEGAQEADNYVSKSTASVSSIGVPVMSSVASLYDEVVDIADVEEFEEEEEDYEDDEIEEEGVEEDPFEFDDEIEDEDMTESDIQEADIDETTTMDNDIKSIDDNSVIDRVVDATGALVAVSTIGANGKEWHQVIDGKIINPDTTVETFTIPDSLTVKYDGEEVVIPAGTYKVDAVVYNADGSVRSVRIEAGDYGLLLQLDSNGNILKTDYIKGENGWFTITNPNYDIIDMYGNNLGKYDSGEYYIYDVMYDSEGNAVAYRLSADGEYEKWVYPNGNTTDGTAVLYNQIQTNEEGTASVSMFEENKGLFGLLGVLFVGLGATLVVRKKVKDKENAAYGEEDSYSNDYVAEDNISTGNYGIYDVKKNDEGLVTEARISPNDSNDEYWVEV